MRIIMRRWRNLKIRKSTQRNPRMTKLSSRTAQKMVLVSRFSTATIQVKIVISKLPGTRDSHSLSFLLTLRKFRVIAVRSSTVTIRGSSVIGSKVIFSTDIQILKVTNLPWKSGWNTNYVRKLELSQLPSS